MSGYAPPSTNAANLDSLVGTFRTVFTKLMQGTAGMLPAKVIEFDRTTNRVTVQPLIVVIDTNNKQIPRAKVPNLPVFSMGGGGFILNFNLQPEDLGWIIANDRDISLFLQNYKQAPPNTFRIKDFADSLFLPHPMTGYNISGEDESNVVLQSLDGTVKISLSSDTIKIQAPTVEIEASTAAEVTAPEVTINGAFKVSGANLSTLGDAGLPIARTGDAVVVNPTTGVGVITGGGLNKSI